MSSLTITTFEDIIIFTMTNSKIIIYASELLTSIVKLIFCWICIQSTYNIVFIHVLTNLLNSTQVLRYVIHLFNLRGTRGEIQTKVCEA